MFLIMRKGKRDLGDLDSTHSLKALKEDLPLHRHPSLPNSSIPIDELLTCAFLLPPIVNQLSPAMDPAYADKSEWRPSFHFVTSAECFPQRSPT
jgi:hypothetical protein